ncbi:MAG: TerB family tellurite resistance protein [Calothrix sp. MO_192.B10]|nr:TerB family tellurite resistance protein [Calothrix sp. MO_192.B10]
MVTETSFKVTPYAQKKYNVTAPISTDVARNYLKVIVAIASADNELAQKELDWFVEEQNLVGVPSDLIEENIIKFDGKGADIEQLLAGIHYDFPINFRRCMLYQAIKMSRADGVYHDKEKAAVARAAQILGIERSVVASLESLVEIEESADRLRLAIFETDV